MGVAPSTDRRGGVVVGRAAELARLDAAIADLRAGHGGAVAVSGEPGIGKTKLLAVIAAKVRAAGLPLLAGRGDRSRLLPAGAPSDRKPRMLRWSQLPDVIPATDGGLVVTVDDLHRAPPELTPVVEDLLGLTAVAPVLLVLAYRPRQLPPDLAALASEWAAASVLHLCPLEPLHRHETRQLLGDRPDLDAIHEAGSGNPRYLQALAAVEPTAALLGELAALTPTQLHVAQTAAALGEPFCPVLLASVCAVDADTTADALDVLVSLDLIRPADPAPLLRFRHPVVADAVYRSGEPSTQRAAHLRIDAELARQGAPPAQRAVHVAAAADPDRPEHVVLLIAAARDTMDSAPDTAARWLTVARGLVPHGDRHRLEIDLLLARTHLLSGRLSDSRDALHSLLPQVGTASDAGVAIAAVLGRAERLLDRYPEAGALVQAGLAVSAEAPEGHVAALQTELADIALDRMDYRAGVLHSAMAVRAARAFGDRTAEAMALSIAAMARLHTDEVTAAHADATAAAALVDGSADQTLIGNLAVLYQVGMAELLLERLHDAERHLSRGAELSYRTGQRYILPSILNSLGEVRYRLGRLPEALASLDEAAYLAAHDHGAAIPSLVAAMRARVRFWLGGSDESALAVAEALRAASACDGLRWAWEVNVRCTLGELLIDAGEPERGNRVLLLAGGGPSLTRLAAWRRPRLWEQLVVAALQRADLPGATRIVEWSTGTVERLPSAARRGYAHRARMRLADARHTVDLAVQAGASAVDCFTDGDMGLEAARTLVELAAICLDAGRVAGVAGRLGYAEELARRGGSRWHAEAVARQRRRLARRSAEPSPLPGLTARELEIATLASTGITSGEIADKLHLSVRTVDSHLGRIYRKLGVSSRAALANVVLTA